jgi:hypothetical protein
MDDPFSHGLNSAWERGGHRIKSLLHLQNVGEADSRRMRLFALYSPDAAKVSANRF